MKHYVCPECKEVSKTPGVCNTPECAQEGVPLTECFCTDGRHLVALGKASVPGDDDDDEAGPAVATEWKNDDVTEDEKDDGHVAGPGKTLDLDRGDDAIEE
jgi:hypothetical protein